jgi:hypothetical protein
MHVKMLNFPVAELHFCQEEKARVIQTLLFVAGINTLCQSFFGTRLPAVMGGSYTVVAPTISIIMAGRYSNETDPHQVTHLLLDLQESPLSHALYDFLVKLTRFVSLLLEIPADYARNARRSHHRVDNSDHTWFQWPLAQCC